MSKLYRAWVQEQEAMGVRRPHFGEWQLLVQDAIRTVLDQRRGLAKSVSPLDPPPPSKP